MADDKNKMDEAPKHSEIFRGYSDALSSRDSMDAVYFNDIIFPKQRAEYYKSLITWQKKYGEDTSKAVSLLKKSEDELKAKAEYLEKADPMFAKIKTRLSKEFSGDDLMNALASDRYFEEKYTPALFKSLRTEGVRGRDFYKTAKPEDAANAILNSMELQGMNPEDFDIDNPHDASGLLSFSRTLTPEALKTLPANLQASIMEVEKRQTPEYAAIYAERAKDPSKSAADKASSIYAKRPESLWSKMSKQMESSNIGKLTPSQYALQGTEGGYQASSGLNLKTAVQTTQQSPFLAIPPTGITPPPPSSQPGTPTPSNTGVGGVSPMGVAGEVVPGAGGQPNNLRNATRSMLPSQTPSPTQAQPNSMLTANAGTGGSSPGADAGSSDLMTFSNMRKDKLKSRYQLQSQGAGWGQGNA